MSIKSVRVFAIEFDLLRALKMRFIIQRSRIESNEKRTNAPNRKNEIFAYRQKELTSRSVCSLLNNRLAHVRNILRADFVFYLFEGRQVPSSVDESREEEVEHLAKVSREQQKSNKNRNQ